MSQTGENIVEVKPVANVYTVLLAVAALGLLFAIGMAGHRLMAKQPAGYGMSAGEILKPVDVPGR